VLTGYARGDYHLAPSPVQGRDLYRTVLRHLGRRKDREVADEALQNLIHRTASDGPGETAFRECCADLLGAVNFLPACGTLRTSSPIRASGCSFVASVPEHWDG
jgi:hypothetical protein